MVSTSYRVISFRAATIDCDHLEGSAVNVHRMNEIILSPDETSLDRLPNFHLDVID